MRINLFLLKIRHLVFFTSLRIPIGIAAVACLCGATFIYHTRVTPSFTQIVVFWFVGLLILGLARWFLYEGILAPIVLSIRDNIKSIRNVVSGRVDTTTYNYIDAYCISLRRCEELLDYQYAIIDDKIRELKRALRGISLNPARQLAKSKLDEAKEELRQNETELFNVIKSISGGVIAPVAV